jgi:hypothetical protein
MHEQSPKCGKPSAMNPYRRAMQMDQRVRPMLPKGRSLLFHGTRSPRQILSDNRLKVAEVGVPAIFLTRMLHVAIYWATLKRERETLGGIFVFDKERLAQRYELFVCRGAFAEDGPDDFGRPAAEAEERIGIDVERRNRYIVDILWVNDNGNIESTRFQRANGDRDRTLLRKSFPAMSHRL